MKKFAVFDIDGTLIRWQLYHAAVDRLAKKGYLGPTARDILHEARMVWKRREHPGSFHDYEQTVVKLYESALTNISVHAFDEVVDEIASEYKEQTYTYTRTLAKTLKEKGYMLFAISGSHHELVGHVARQYEFDDWVGSTYERRGDTFSGKKTIGKSNKADTLEKLVHKHSCTYKDSYGVGDSQSDAALLSVVSYPIAFNPDAELFTLSKKHGWTIVVERKNVVYELKAAAHGYILK